MPRVPRQLTVIPDHQVHKIWRGHNREWNLGNGNEKQVYLNFIQHEQKNSVNHLHAIVVMSNHTHEIYTIHDVPKFSNEMRRAHSRYGMYFNRAHKRCGKVAQDRPKTCTISSDEYAMRATFYIHANPLRAKMVKTAESYTWSTHQLYAYGKRPQWLKQITLPDWYLNLGKSLQVRQAKYRQLFDAFLREVGLIQQNFLSAYFYGPALWQLQLTEKVKQWRKDHQGPSPGS